MKTIIVILLLVSFCFSEDKNFAIDASCGLSNSIGHFYIPNPSLSFYWLKDDSYKDFTTEFYFNTKKSEGKKEWDLNIGLSYSKLFNLNIQNLFFGPTVGLIIYSHQNYIQQFGDVYLSNGGETGTYLLGAKFSYILGDNIIRFKVQDRFLLGLKSIQDPMKSTGVGFLNTLNVGIIFAF
jgi:hypothetical protein